jgi:fructoselysine 6-kinase
MKVLGLGDNVVDCYEHTRLMYPGGNAANFSAYACMLGHEAAYLGIFGSDKAGEHVRSTLAAMGVDTSHCMVAQGPNGSARLMIHGGERVFLGSNEGGVRKHTPVAPLLVARDYLQSFELIHTSRYSYIDAHLPALHRLGTPLSYDFSDDFSTDQALLLCADLDYAFFSCAEMNETDTRALLAAATAYGCRVAVATRGAAPALLHDGAGWYSQPTLPIKPVDTLGAGDAFITAFLVTLLETGNPAPGVISGARIETALHAASAFAARACMVDGAFGHGIAY